MHWRAHRKMVWGINMPPEGKTMVNQTSPLEPWGNFSTFPLSSPKRWTWGSLSRSGGFGDGAVLINGRPKEGLMLRGGNRSAKETSGWDSWSTLSDPWGFRWPSWRQVWWMKQSHGRRPLNSMWAPQPIPKSFWWRWLWKVDRCLRWKWRSRVDTCTCPPANHTIFIHLPYNESFLPEVLEHLFRFLTQSFTVIR